MSVDDENEHVWVRLRYADGSWGRAHMPKARLAVADTLRREHGEVAYRTYMRGLASEFKAAPFHPPRRS